MRSCRINAAAPFLLGLGSRLSQVENALRSALRDACVGRYITQIVVEFPNFRNPPSPSLFIRNLLSYSEYHA